MITPGYRQLICEILLLTCSDLNLRAKRGGRYFQNRQEALAFLETEWFEAMCNAIDLSPDAVREGLSHGTFQQKLKSC